MKIYFMYIIALFCLFSLSSCGDDGRFSISGEIEGNPNMNIYISYYGSGKVQSGIARVQEGKFEISGVSRNPTVIEITDNEKNAFGYLFLSNGDEAKVLLNRSNPFLMKASGTKLMEEWTTVANSFADEYAKAQSSGNSSDLNDRILKHMQSNPSSQTSALLFATAFDAKADQMKAAEALQALLPEALSGGIVDSYITVANRFTDGDYLQPIDSIPYRDRASSKVRYIRPAGHKATLISFSQPDASKRKFRNDTVLPAFEDLLKLKGMQVVDFVLSADTNSWKNFVSADSATWIQAWAPGSIFARGVDRLQLQQLPYYIVVDSAGRQAYRGSSLSQAEAEVRSVVK